MKVNSGDLIHADRHGAVVVPIDNIDKMKAALDGLHAREAKIIKAAKEVGDRGGDQGGDERLDWTMTSRRRDRRESNPALGSRRLKLGTFQTNLDSGCVMSDLEGRLDITWPNTVALARLAEEMEFEAIVPVARWQGFGGATNPQGPGFEAYTWAAGIAAATTTPGVFATSHITLNHPIIAAKQSTVIDHISRRPLRAQHRDRMEPAGNRHVRQPDAGTRGPLRLRRGVAHDHQAIVDRGRRVRLRRAGSTRSRRATCSPSRSEPVSGSHERRRLRARPPLCGEICRHGLYGDPAGSLDDCRAHVQAYHKLAREEYGRDVRVWTLANIVQGETEKEARDLYR